MGRRRLALRQIDEREDARAASDADSDGAVERPRFDLLGAAAGSAGSAGAGGGALALYQDGPSADLPLQLAFVRRRAPRALRDGRTRVEDEFVVPRPELALDDFVPSGMDVPLEELWAASAPASFGSAGRGERAALLDATARARALESAGKLLKCPGRATEEDYERWRSLDECDWRQAFQRAGEVERRDGERGEDAHGGGVIASLPSAADICHAVERCQSDALAQFVWDDLLPPLIDRAVFGSSETKQSADSASHESTAAPLSGVRSLLAALVRHPSFARMKPKAFRALVRARNLRQIDEVAGAQLELELVALFQRQQQRQVDSQPGGR